MSSSATDARDVPALLDMISVYRGNESALWDALVCVCEEQYLDPHEVAREHGATPPDNPTMTKAVVSERGREPVISGVMRDLCERQERGRKYGQILQRTHDGRDSLVDTYQELLDAVVYLRKAIDERADEEGRR